MSRCFARLNYSQLVTTNFLLFALPSLGIIQQSVSNNIRILITQSHMGLGSIFRKRTHLVGIDIGASAVKLVEFDLSGEQPVLVAMGSAPLNGEVFQGNVIVKPELVTEQIQALISENAREGEVLVVTALPGPSVFIKRAKIARVASNEIEGHIRMEAGNLIPHNIDAVKLDYNIIGESADDQLDVVLVAAKNEIVESFSEMFAEAGITLAVLDVEYFALQNIFETRYPELKASTVALIDVGHRYSAVNICRGGDSLFSGDISSGGKSFIEALAEGAGISVDKAGEALRRMKTVPEGEMGEVVNQIVDQMATEFNRQLSFFWNASGADAGIDRIMLSGGASLVPGLAVLIKERTGIEVSTLDPFRGVEIGASLEAAEVELQAPFMAIAAGLALRAPGDRQSKEVVND